MSGDGRQTRLRSIFYPDTNISLIYQAKKHIKKLCFLCLQIYLSYKSSNTNTFQGHSTKLGLCLVLCLIVFSVSAFANPVIATFCRSLAAPAKREAAGEADKAILDTDNFSDMFVLSQ